VLEYGPPHLLFTLLLELKKVSSVFTGDFGVLDSAIHSRLMCNWFILSWDAVPLTSLSSLPG